MNSKRLFSKMLFTLLCLLLLAALTACGEKEESVSQGDMGDQGEKTIKLRIGSGYTPEGAPWTRVVKEYFVPEVSKKLEGSGYAIEWTELYGGTVAKPGEELEAVQTGLLDMAFVVSPLEPSELKISNLGYNVPFSSSDPAVVNKATYAIYEKYPEFAGEYEKANQKVLALGVTESYELLTKFPVEKIEQLKGVKIGAAGSNLNWIKPAGAIPVQATFPEMYQSLQSGVFDGVVSYSGSAYGYKLHEQAKYFTKVGFGCGIIGALTVNQNAWDKLPAEVQQVIQDVAGSYSDMLVKEINEDRETSIEKMEQEGAVIATLSDQERAKWTQLVADIPNRYAQHLNEAGLPGSEIVRDYIQAQIDAGYQFPAPYKID